MKTILTLTFLFSTGFNFLFACSCGGSSIGSAYEKASTVIYGKVVEKKNVEIKATIRPEMYDTVFNTLELKNYNYDKNEYFSFKSVIQVKVEIIEQYKEQSLVDTVIIFTLASSASCGYTRFETGKDFLIFGFDKNFILNRSIDQSKKIDLGKENSFWTHLCTSNAPAQEKDLEQIRNLALPKFNKVSFEIALTALMSRNLINMTKDTLHVLTSF